MAKQGDGEFRPRSGRGRSDGRFISQVLQAAGPGAARTIGRTRRGGPGPRGRGHVAAALGLRALGPRGRRVVVKTRLVVLRQRLPAATRRHLRYLQREGSGPQLERARAYGPETDVADVKGFAERSGGDRHQFRFIVSAEEGLELGDLRDFTRALMQRVSRDLGTELEWVAVDHQDTDNPHTHILLRGKTGRGEDLVISRDYITHGMRGRACELATEWLGPRTEQEIRASQVREVDAERFTGLDRALLAEARDGVLDLREVPVPEFARRARALRLGRLARLAKLGLATEQQPGVWAVSATAERRLREMGERVDIVRTMQRALGPASHHFAVFDPEHGLPVTGRVVAKGLADELSERGYLIVEGLEGRSHYVGTNGVLNLPVGAIVEVRALAGPRWTDQNIANNAVNGTYRTAIHISRTHAEAVPGLNPEAFVAAHTRRLEALSRAGIVERLENGVWRIPADLPAQGLAYDRRRLGGAQVEMRSALPIERQTRALGVTWLDQQLPNGPLPLAPHGFGHEVRQALAARADFLIAEGLAERQHGQLRLHKDLLPTLRDRELARVAAGIETKTGGQYRALRDGGTVSGKYRQSLQLISGRFALIDDGTGFSLVPWQPALERHLGEQVRGMIRGQSIEWTLGRQRGLSL